MQEAGPSTSGTQTDEAAHTEQGTRHNALPQNDWSQDSIVPETQSSQMTESAQETELEKSSEAGGATTPASPATDEPQTNGSEAEGRTTTEAPVESATRSTSSVTAEEMFSALVADMKASPTIGQVEARRATVKELFAIEYRVVPVQEAALPADRKRFPTPYGAEAASLLALFEQVFVLCSGTYAEWKQLATAISHELLTTKWAFKEIIRRLASRHKWAQAPVLNQWAQTVKRGTEAPVTGMNQVEYEDFMFNPAKFSTEETTRLKDICGAPATGNRLRVATEDEWSIITGMVEGSIVCRRMLPFMRQVFDGKERLRVYSTIQAQVEGELVLHLNRHRGVRISRQSTKALTETILESAELARVNLQALHAMLGQTKTISYDQVTKTIHFFFFTRDTAVLHRDVLVPYMGGIYRLQNAHQQARGTVWQRQQGPDDTVTQRRAEYTILLYNLTRFNEIGRIAAFLQAKIPTEFEMEDLDTYNPNSRTSTLWRVTFKLAGCPTFLQGVVRLLWFGTIIVIKHPNVGRRIQCLQCGNLGHTVARCRFTDEQLRGPRGVEVSEEEITHLEDLARPFSSLEEMKTMADKRLKLQQAAEAAAQAAVTPEEPANRRSTPPVKEQDDKEQKGVAAEKEQGEQFAHLQPEPKPPAKQPWITKPLRGDQRLWAHKSAMAEKRLPSTGSYQVLSDEDGAPAPKTPDNGVSSTVARPEVVDLTGADEISIKPAKQAKLTAKDNARKQAGKARGKAPVSIGPVLMTKKRQERATFQSLSSTLVIPTSAPLSMGPRTAREPESMQEVEAMLGIREVTTPATGNCMAMAVAQAAVDATLEGPDSALKSLTASIKRGIKYTGLLHLEDQLAHDHRVNALANVRRGWPTMTRSESATQMR